MKARNLASRLGNVNASGRSERRRPGGNPRHGWRSGPRRATPAGVDDRGHHRRHLGHHLVGAERAGVDLDGVVGPRSGAAARVESRSSRATISARVVSCSAGLPAARSSATRRRARSSARGGQEELRLGVGEDHRPDVAPLDHHAAGAADPALQVRAAPPAPRAAPRRATRRRRSRGCGSPRSRPRRSAKTWLTSPSSRNESSRPSARAATPGPSSQAIPARARPQGHRPVDRARVEQRVSEALGQQARGGRFSGPRGPVNRHDQLRARSTSGLGASRSCGSATGSRRRTPCPGAATWRAR